MAPVRPRRPTASATVSRRRADPRGRYAPPSPSHHDNVAPPIANDERFAAAVAAAADDDDFGFGDAFKLSKRDKRAIKHGNLLHKVREAGVGKQKKRRRPGKKLNADIGDLAEALPEVQVEHVSSDGRGPAEQVGKMKMKSLKHKPGAMKRKHDMETAEKERFGRNLAQLAGQQTAAPTGTGDRWAALRGFIAGTMEQDRAFTS